MQTMSGYHLIIILAACSISAFAQSPVDYSTRIFNAHAAVANKNMEYLQYAIHSEDLAQIEQKRSALIRQIQESAQEVKAMPPFGGDSRLRDEIAGVLQVYLESYQSEFQKVNFLKQSSKESFEAMDQYLKASDAAEKKLLAASDRAQAAQKAFAQKHNIQLVEDEEKAAGAKTLTELNSYHRAIFLPLFKLNKKDAEFSVALGAQDAAKMERIRVDLESAAKEGITFLKTIPDFKGDAAYRTAAMAQAQYYAEMAAGGYKTMVEVVRKGDKITNADVDAFNKAVTQSNEKAPALSEAVNTSVNNLFKAHVPKPIPTRKI
jgi:hypothetical protein